MKIATKMILLVWILGSPLAFAVGPADIERGAIIAKDKCAICHNADGNSSSDAFPKIAGQHAGYLSEQLVEFSKGEQGKRNNPIMKDIAASLSEQDIVDVSAYFASKARTAGGVSEDLLALGQKIYRGGNVDTGVPACAACHGPHGEGNGPARFPNLSGQYAKYIASQLEAFASETRTNDPNGMMVTIAKKMSDKEIQAVSSYASGVH